MSKSAVTTRAAAGFALRQIEAATTTKELIAFSSYHPPKKLLLLRVPTTQIPCLVWCFGSLQSQNPLYRILLANQAKNGAGYGIFHTKPTNFH